MKKFNALLGCLIFFCVSCVANMLGIASQEYAFMVITIIFLILVGIIISALVIMIVINEGKGILIKTISENKKALITWAIIFVAYVTAYPISVFALVKNFNLNTLQAYETTWFITAIIATFVEFIKEVIKRRA